MKDVDGNALFGLRFVSVVIVLTMAPTLSFAYIDPGNGAYMVQALFAMVGAALFYLRHPVRSLKEAWNWTRQRFNQSKDEAGGEVVLPETGSDANPSEPTTVSLQERA